MSLWFFFATLGNIAGPIVGTYIATSLGYEYAFYTSMGIVWAAIALLSRSPTFANGARTPPQVKLHRPLFAGFTQLLRIPTIQKTCTLTLLGFLGCSARRLLPPHLRDRAGGHDRHRSRQPSDRGSHGASSHFAAHRQDIGQGRQKEAPLRHTRHRLPALRPLPIRH